MHQGASLVTGGIAGAIFVWMITRTQNKWKIDDVLGAWPLHGLCGVWGGLAAGIFGTRALGGWIVYGVLKQTLGIRLDAEQEFEGADLSIHKISSTAERETSW